MKKFVKSLQVNLFLAGFSHLKLMCSTEPLELSCVIILAQRCIGVPQEFHGFANMVGMMKECWNFLWGVISGGT